MVRTRRQFLDSIFYGVRSGCQWRLLPRPFPPAKTLYDQTQRWINAGSLETIVQDLHEVFRIAWGRNAQPSAEIVQAGDVRATRPSGANARHHHVEHALRPLWIRRPLVDEHDAVDKPDHVAEIDIRPYRA